ncbi:MAG: helix-turn-helix domain-containing protein [Devosia sp.]|nr:helix-turn-helix domain-containing protein [Devosia sp.]
MAGPSTSRDERSTSFAYRAAARRTGRRALADSGAAAVLARVSEDRSVSLLELLQPSRGPAEVAHARQLAMYLVHTLLGRTLTEVGTLFGRDRSTVAHACALIEDERERAEFDQAVGRLEAAIAERRAVPVEAMETYRAAG